MNRLFMILVCSSIGFLAISQSLEYGLKGGANLSRFYNEGSDFDL